VIEFTVESAARIEREIAPLIAAHAAESAYLPLDLECAHYFALDDAARLVTVTARDDGRLVGYDAFTVGAHPHFATAFHAVNEGIFVAPGSRRAAVSLIRAAERHLARAALSRYHGSVRIHYQSPGKLPRVGKLFEALGYEMIGMLWSKTVAAG